MDIRFYVSVDDILTRRLLKLNFRSRVVFVEREFVDVRIVDIQIS